MSQPLRVYLVILRRIQKDLMPNHTLVHTPRMWNSFVSEGMFKEAFLWWPMQSELQWLTQAKTKAGLQKRRLDYRYVALSQSARQRVLCFSRPRQFNFVCCVPVFDERKRKHSSSGECHYSTAGRGTHSSPYSYQVRVCCHDYPRVNYATKTSPVCRFHSLKLRNEIEIVQAFRTSLSIISFLSSAPYDASALISTPTTITTSTNGTENEYFFN